MADPHVYRCSQEMSEAVIERAQQQREFREQVWNTWQTEHPHVGLAYRRKHVSVDLEVRGFLPEGKVPGLSMSLRRGYALPVRGRMGDPWRTDLARVQAYPSMDAVFAVYGVPTGAWVDDDVVDQVGLEISPERTLYVQCSVDLFDGQPGEMLPDAIRRVTVGEFRAVQESNRALREASTR